MSKFAVSNLKNETLERYWILSILSCKLYLSDDKLRIGRLGNYLCGQYTKRQPLN